LNNCLLRNHEGDFCKPLSPIYIGLHGANGHGGRVAASNTPADYHGLLLADSPAREGQAKVYDVLGSYVKSFNKQFADVKADLVGAGKSDNEIRVKSLYLWSEAPGTGKTTSAVALLNEYLVAHYIGHLKRKEMPAQRPCYFLDANLLQTEYNTFNRPRVPDDIAEPASRRYYNAIERGKHTEFVVIDDLATRDATDAFRADLHSVINHRVTNQLPTIFTSNIPISELANVFGEQRLADRVGDMCMELHFKGESKRGMRK